MPINLALSFYAAVSELLNEFSWYWILGHFHCCVLTHSIFLLKFYNTAWRRRCISSV